MRRLYTTDLASREILTLVGIDRQGFINHVDKYLIDGMTKDTFGKTWGLDHIVPVHLFDSSNIEELSLCYNYNNIMPMFNTDNRIKGASIHFSLEKLKAMYTNVYIEKLISKCYEEINQRYTRYLIS